MSLLLRKYIPPPPTLSYADHPATALENASASYSPTATDITSYALQAGTLPDGLTLNTGTGVVSGVLGELAFEDGPAYALTIRGTGPGGTVDASLAITATNVLGVSGAKVQYLAGTSDGQYRVRFVSEEAPMGRTVVDFEVLVAPRPIEPRNVTAIYAAGGEVFDGYTPTDSAGGVEETLTVDRGTPAGGEVDQVVVRNVYDDASKGAWLMGGWGVDCVVAGTGWPTQSSPTTITQAALDAVGDGPYTLPGGANAQYLIDTDLTMPKFGIAASANGQAIFSNNGSTLWFACDGPAASASFPPTLSARAYGFVGVYTAALYGLKIRQGPVTAYYSYAYRITTYDAATTYGLYRHETLITVAAGQGSIQATTDALVAALNASGNALFSAITWARADSGDSSYLTGTHDTADTPWRADTYVTGGAGEWQGTYEGLSGDLTFADYAIATKTLLRARDCTFEVRGVRSDAYLLEYNAWEQNVSIVNCTLKTRGYHGNRHQGWCAIMSDGGGAQTGALRFQRNDMDTAHLGFRIRFSAADADHPIVVSHNHIYKSVADGVVNGYGLNAHGRWQHFHMNLVEGNRQGIHADKESAYGQDCEFLDNVVDVEPAPHADFANVDVHGIKHEFAPGTLYERNHITATTESSGMPSRHAHALNVSGKDAGLSLASTGTLVRHNFFQAVAPTTAMQAIGHYSEYSFGETTDSPVEWNVFEASTQHFRLGAYFNYDRSDGDLLEHNLFLEEGTSAFDSSFAVVNGDGDSEEWEILDSPEDFTDAAKSGGGSGAYSVHQSYTLTIYVHDNGTPVSGATVTVVNAAAGAQFSGTTDANGIVRGKYHRYSTAGTANGAGTITDHGQADVTVSKGGYTTYNADHTVGGTMALKVRLDNTTAAVDADAISAPTSGVAFERSCTGAYIAWTAPAATSGIKGYRVTVAGETQLVTAETSYALFGLTPATEYAANVLVYAVGWNGDESTALTLPTFTTQAEIRGA